MLDENQSTLRARTGRGDLFKSWKKLAIFDEELHQKLKTNKEFLENLADDCELVIDACLRDLKIAEKDCEEFLTIALVTLPGFASYVKYLGDWKNGGVASAKIKEEFLAIRLVIFKLIYSDAKDLLKIFQENREKFDAKYIVERVERHEKKYQQNLLKDLENRFNNIDESTKKADAQVVFCIDVRSEKIRHFIESVGNYETFGFAGFFGISLNVKNKMEGKSFDSCPVLLKPQHHVEEKSKNACLHKKHHNKLQFGNKISAVYQGLKYNFTTPVILAEALGFVWGALILARGFFNKNLTNDAIDRTDFSIDISGINLDERTATAESMLRAIGLTNNFADIVILCGHGSKTTNNSYATSLDCGACGGNHGDANVKAMAQIFNDLEVRKVLAKNGIKIPSSCKFIAAKHNTTNDEIYFYEGVSDKNSLSKIRQDFTKARYLNNIYRANSGFKKNFSYKENKALIANDATKFFDKKTASWCETRPEWGLAGNAAFIVADRNFTKNIDLEGRAFLHSYKWQGDEDGKILESIMTAPLVVAQWINSQYLFSTLDNIAFGCGSKVTHNIVGKIGIMQGNSSDLMNGLPLQSVFSRDRKNHHQPLRLSAVINAPKERIVEIINRHQLLQNLFQNSWIHLFCFDENEKNIFQLQAVDLSWQSFGSSESEAEMRLWKSL